MASKEQKKATRRWLIRILALSKNYFEAAEAAASATEATASAAEATASVAEAVASTIAAGASEAAASTATSGFFWQADRAAAAAITAIKTRDLFI